MNDAKLPLSDRQPIGLGPRAAAGTAGLIAGMAYLGAQMVFSALFGFGGALASLQRIAAILLGPDAAPPTSPAPTDLAMGMLIHLSLSLVAGYIIGHLARSRSAVGAAVMGAGIGLGFFLVIFYVIAPSAFPWFVEVRNAATAADHLIFGAITGYLAITLQRERSLPGS